MRWGPTAYLPQIIYIYIATSLFSDTPINTIKDIGFSKTSAGGKLSNGCQKNPIMSQRKDIQTLQLYLHPLNFVWWVDSFERCGQ